MSLVIDASVAIKWFVIEPQRDEALAIIDDQARKISLDYWPVHSYTMSNEVSYIEPKARVY